MPRVSSFSINDCLLIMFDEGAPTDEIIHQVKHNIHNVKNRRWKGMTLIAVETPEQIEEAAEAARAQFAGQAAHR